MLGFRIHRPWWLVVTLTIFLGAYGAEKTFNASEYYVQAGAFSNASNAKRFQQHLEQQYHQPSRITQVVSNNNNTLYKVQLGPIASKQQASALKHKLQEAEPNTPSSTTEVPVSKLTSITSDFTAALSSALNNNTAPTKMANNTTPSDEIAPPVVKNNGYKIKSNRPKSPQRIWNLRNANIRAVISEVAKVTGKNFIVDPRVQGKVTIMSTKPMSTRELYQVFLSVLQVSGFAAIPSGPSIKIVPNIDAKSQGNDIASRIQPGRGDEMVVRVLPIKYVPAEQLVPVLRPLMPQWSNVSAYGPSNMLILSGRASNIQRLSDIVRRVDSPSSSGIDIIPLRRALAQDVVDTLKDLITSPKAGSQSSRLTIAADDRSNSILISGSRSQRLRMRVLITQLDTQSPSGTDGTTQVIYLKFLRANDLVPILAGIAQANFSGKVGTTIGTITIPQLDTSSPISDQGTSVSGSGGGSYGGDSASSFNASPASVNSAASPNTQGASTTTSGDNKPQVQIIAEPNTNSIILNAPPILMRTLKTVIRQLDVRPTQVLIEAIIAEMNEKDVKQLGIEWGTLVVGTDNSTAGESAPSGLLNVVPGVGVISKQTKLNDFGVKIQALITNNKLNILSSPSLMVLDNHQAKILVGQQVSIENSTYPGNAGGTTVANPFTTFDRQNVALHLYVRPQISHGRNIKLQIDQGNDTLQNPNDTSGRPVINVSSINTSVLVRSGNILVLGGLKQNKLDWNGNKMPILGGIPGVGQLFQNNRREREKRVLMVFIRPYIVESQNRSMRITGTKYDTLRQTQLDWLQDEPYNKNNSKLVLKPLTTVELPMPFHDIALGSK